MLYDCKLCYPGCYHPKMGSGEPPSWLYKEAKISDKSAVIMMCIKKIDKYKHYLLLTVGPNLGFDHIIITIKVKNYAVLETPLSANKHNALLKWKRLIQNLQHGSLYSGLPYLKINLKVHIYKSKMNYLKMIKNDKFSIFVKAYFQICAFRGPFHVRSATPSLHCFL